MKEELLAQILEALLAIRGLVVQKTKLIGDCGRLLRELLDSLLQESYENKRHFIRACVSGLSRDRNGRSPVVILLGGDGFTISQFLSFSWQTDVEYFLFLVIFFHSDLHFRIANVS